VKDEIESQINDKKIQEATIINKIYDNKLDASMTA